MTKIWMPEYSDKRVYGAVAFLTEDTGTASMAEKKGLLSSGQQAIVPIL